MKEEDIERMMDIYEISELSEESGLQEEFKKDIHKIFLAGQNSQKEKDLEMIEEVNNESEEFTTIEQYKRKLKQKIKEDEE